MAYAELGSAVRSDDRLRSRWAVTRRWPWRWVLLVLFAGLQFADVVSTNYALAVSGVWEANPLMALSQAKLGSAWWLPKLVAIGLVTATAPRSRRRWPIFFVVSFSAATVLVNLAHF